MTTVALPAVKACTKCKKIKPLDHFSPRTDIRAGRSSQCLGCRREAQQARRDSVLPPRKSCGSCGKRKPLDAYPVNPHREDGRGSWCTSCFEAEAERTRRAIARRRAAGALAAHEPVIEPDPVEIGVSWQKRAACGLGNADLFFSDFSTQTEHARGLCGSCPVAEQCAVDAALSRTRHGVWAGTARK